MDKTLQPYELFNMIRNQPEKDYKHVGRHTDYFIKTIDNTIYVLFQDSKGFWDWFINFFYIPVKVKAYHDMKEEMKVTAGFILEYKDARARILIDVLKEIRNIKANGLSDIHVICVGWSHGCTLSQICAEDISYCFYDGANGEISSKPDVIGFGGSKFAFGQPTVDTILKRLGKVVLYQREGDPVPDCPPKCTGVLPLVEYTHVKGIHSKTFIGKLINMIKAHTGYGDPSIY